MMNSNSIILTLADLCQYLKEHDNYLVLTHASPDGDTLGSAYALKLGLKKLGKKVQVICPDEIPHKYDYFIDDSECDFIPETVVAVDVADIKLLGDMWQRFEGRIDLNIDHHISNTNYAKRLYLDETASATAESVYEILDELGVEFDRNIANALYTGISTDTGCFKYANVTVRTHEIAAKLYAIGVDAADINRIMFDTKSKSRVKMEMMVLNGAEFHFDDRCMTLAVTLDIQKQTGCSKSDMEGVASMSRSVEGVLVGVAIKETEKNVFKISLRTYDPLDASEICKKLGGGGHKAAAGCTVEGSLKDAKDAILSAIKESLEEIDAGANITK
ncbi:MAG: bifunctional oligoribonuclease/PAP phosphatase NrnA [Clostridia bacterium]|nr:bifunctional oligoribonuclease/PAP phosphatase NrnA [Clostridia bacterium]